jgi:hypothetical protein
LPLPHKVHFRVFFLPKPHSINTANIGLVKLDVSNTGLGKTGTAALGVALKKNVKTSSTLFYLSLDGNKLEAEVNILFHPHSHLLMLNARVLPHWQPTWLLLTPFVLFT